MSHIRTRTSVTTRAKPDAWRGGASGGVELSARTRVYCRIKAVIEWIAAFVLLVAALPVLAIVGIVLKLTSAGPVFYQQTRLGRHGKPFRLRKLRTMTHECEAKTGPVWSIAGDPRVTKVGRWLRDTHLDELPQLWNVLCGEMSLIGPRPERPGIAEKIERAMPEFRDRLLVRPGITGLAQMRLPADSDLHTVRRKLTHDLHYIRHMGPILDATVSLSTLLHFVGMAATAMSRQCVGPFAPRHIAVEDIPDAGHGLLVSGQRFEGPYPMVPPEELSRAA